MPQMSPMYWLLLIFFIFVMVFLMTFTYFSYFNISKEHNIKTMKSQFDWLW